jgi:hypothetical protein
MTLLICNHGVAHMRWFEDEFHFRWINNIPQVLIVYSDKINTVIVFVRGPVRIFKTSSQWH